MSWCTIFTIVIHVLFLTVVDATFFIESNVEQNIEIAGPGGQEENSDPKTILLYKCEHKDSTYGNPVTECSSLRWWWQKQAVYAVTNFYSVTRLAQFEPGQTLLFDGEKVTKAPNVLAVGFKPGTIDMPNFQTPVSSCERVHRAVEGLTPDLVCKDDRVVNNVSTFLCVNDVRVFLTDPTVRDDVLPTFTSTLNRIMTVYDSYILPYDASKFALLESCKKAILLMLPKMIDPCIIFGFAKTRDDRFWVNVRCRLYCQFLSTARKVFGVVSCKCSFLKCGKCVNGVCVCAQYFPFWRNVHRPKVLMLQCNNDFRFQFSLQKRLG